METFDVELVKDSRGLGITIAGYVEKTAGKCLVFESLNFSQNSSNFVGFIELILTCSAALKISYCEEM